MFYRGCVEFSTALGSTAILTIVSLSIDEQGKCFHLFLFSSISYITVCGFSCKVFSLFG